MTSEQVNKTKACVPFLWDHVLLRSALELRDALDFLPPGVWDHHAHVRDLIEILDVLEGEMIVRGMGNQYLQRLLSNQPSPEDAHEVALP